ncbi:uncharacterized protein [Ptychodera flava]|uniref:uncharacterized protein n=1 Tax=Ptychodera flava TaxID=63121 RepID=UPI00396A0242
MGSKFHSTVGSFLNYICLPDEPIYGTVESGVQSDRALAYATEYRGSTGPFNVHRYFDVPCAVCKDELHSNIILYPARSDCPGGWDVEYYGFLMSAAYNSQSTEYVCLDVEGARVTGTGASTNQGRLYPVEVTCNNGAAILCSPYVHGNELSCAVCAY